MSVMDRAIAAVSPGWAARRVLARVQLSEASRIATRQAAGHKRFADNWRIDDRSDRATLATGSRKALTAVDRARLRRVFRLNPFARKAKGTLINNLVGYGITGAPQNSKPALNAWNDWVPHADYDGVHDFYGIQELAVGTMLVDGEVFVIKRIVSPSVVNPLRLQVLKVDQLDCTIAAPGTRDGIEYGADGRPSAYLFKRALDSTFEQVGGGSSERIPAEDVIHLFRREEPGQWRGRSHFEAVIDALNDCDDYVEAEGVRKKIEACFVGMVKRSPDAPEAERPVGDPGGGSEGEGSPRIESFYPGMVHYLDQGEEIEFGEPKASEGLADFLRWGSLRAAAGADVTYEGLTGDLSNVNFTSYRAGNNEFKRFIGRLQWLTIIPRLCVGVEQAWLEAGYATGRLGKRKVTFKWTPPAFESVNPVADANAAILEMQAGLDSRRNKLSERGYDHDQLMEEIAADTAANLKRNVTFKGDPFTPGAANATAE